MPQGPNDAMTAITEGAGVADSVLGLAPALPSAWQIGTDVYLPGTVAGVQFTEGKVHYIVRLGGEEEVLVDSVSVCRDPA